MGRQSKPKPKPNKIHNMSFFAAIQTAFLHLWSVITGLSDAAFHYVNTTLVPVLKTDAGNLLIALAPLALQAVVAAETPGAAGKDKFNAALASIKAAATTAGISAGTSVLNLAIESAVQQLKANEATSPTSVAPAASTGN